MARARAVLKLVCARARCEQLEQWAHATGGFTSMYVFGSSRTLELSTDSSSLKEAILVFEGDFTDAADKKRIVDVMLGLWSLILARQKESFEVGLIYARINAERARAFPKEQCGGASRRLDSATVGRCPHAVASPARLARLPNGRWIEAACMWQSCPRYSRSRWP